MKIYRVGALVGLWMTGCGDADPAMTASGSTGTAGELDTGTPTAGSSGSSTEAGSMSTSATSQTPTTTAATDEPTETTAAAGSCSDGVQSGDETDVDCGGNCPRCGDGASCGGDGDCASMHCIDGVCAPAECSEDADCAGFAGACAVGVCDRGACVAEALADGMACDDMQVCTAGPAACANGVCVDLEGSIGKVFLADVTAGIGGFAIDGTPGEEHGLGRTATLIPDFNGDGLAEIATGMEFFNGGRGRVWVVYGKPDMSKVLASDIVAGIGGFILDGPIDGRVGSALAGADINGDGLGDLLIGAGSTDPGRIYVVLGAPDLGGITLAKVAAGSGGFVIDPKESNTGVGINVADAGDVNKDGVGDILVGDHSLSIPGKINIGRTYVVFGKQDTDPVALSDIAAGQGGFAIDGEEASDQSGYMVSSAGDFNGDGLADLYLDAHAPFGVRRAYVVFGKQDTAKVMLADVAAGVGGLVLFAESQSNFLLPAREAGDVNGDGLDDLVIGDQSFTEGMFFDGRAYVLFGTQDTTPVHLSDVAAGVGGFIVSGFGAGVDGGSSVAPLGDLDGDDLADILVTVPDSGPGRAVVVFGKQDTSPVLLDALLAGQGGFTLEGEGGGGNFGSVPEAADGGHDVDGDGIPDMVVGLLEMGEDYSGRVYMVRGGDCHP